MTHERAVSILRGKCRPAVRCPRCGHLPQACRQRRSCARSPALQDRVQVDESEMAGGGMKSAAAACSAVSHSWPAPRGPVFAQEASSGVDFRESLSALGPRLQRALGSAAIWLAAGCRLSLRHVSGLEDQFQLGVTGAFQFVNASLLLRRLRRDRLRREGFHPAIDSQLFARFR